MIRVTVNTLGSVSLLLFIVLVGCKNENNTSDSILDSQLKNITKTPVKFENGTISTVGIEYNSSFSKTHSEFYFSMAAPDFSFRNIMVSKFNNGQFKTPEKVKIGGVVYNASDVQISRDGQNLIFKMPGNLRDTTRTDNNIWKSKRVESAWSNAELLPKEVNSELSEFYPILTNSGNLYFSRELRETSYDIYVSKFVDNKYQEAEALPDYINTKLLESDAYISPDESFMIFIRMYSDDGFGMSDLYISFNKNGTWSMPKNMTKYNSKGIDGSPFVTSDGKYLFFTSNRDSKNLKAFDGHLDIYVAKFDIDDWR